MNRSKIKGLIVGGAVGDALGMPVETWGPNKIFELYPDGITEYFVPKHHKWFDGSTPAGTTTDDTQLTLATLRGIIAGHKKVVETSDFNHYMDAIAIEHCSAMKETDAGWGNTTREAIRRLQNNVHWSKSGHTDDAHRGTGNGVPMKISPLAAWYATVFGANFGQDQWSFNQRLVEYSAMTHNSQMSALSAVIHTHAVYQCLWSTPSSFDINEFVTLISETCFGWNRIKPEHFTHYDTSHLNESKDSLEERLQILASLATPKNKLVAMSSEEIAKELGNGSCYVYDSLPFTYAFFLQNPYSISSIRTVIEAGGDTDTNAKMVGEMLGALHGLEIFELPKNRWTIEGLVRYGELIDLADEFCDMMEIDDGMESTTLGNQD